MYICRILLVLSFAIALTVFASPAPLPLDADDSSPNNATHSANNRSPTFEWGKTKVRGVSLGGWLVLEPFITLNLFDDVNRHNDANKPIVDEWTFCERLGRDRARATLQRHWDSFVSVNDFKKIAGAGFNVVRIPVGYWAYVDVQTTAPFVTGAAEYVDRAIEWARQTGLKIIIDLHGAPGSQNGFDHSGQKRDKPGWGHDHGTVEQTMQVVKILIEKYAETELMNDVVVGIQVLNEPFIAAGVDKDTLYNFYKTAYTRLRLTSRTALILHDGFELPSSLNNLLTPSSSPPGEAVVVDTHYYQMFGDGVKLSATDHLKQTCADQGRFAHGTGGGSDKWTIVGEWSGAMTDCARYLNGWNIGNRYEGTWYGSERVGDCRWPWVLSGDVADWPGYRKDDVRRYIEGQLDAFEKGTEGWIFWNFRIEGGEAGEWDLYQLLDAGVFPQPLTDRRFKNVCDG